jgi:hypothetical protein
MRSSRAVDELSGYSDLIAGPADASFKYVSRLQLTADRSQVYILILELKRGRAPNDRNARDLGEKI